ncbi:hypothetical protein ACFL33_04050 [Pseudomonadota bacterium]
MIGIEARSGAGQLLDAPHELLENGRVQVALDDLVLLAVLEAGVVVYLDRK